MILTCPQCSTRYQADAAKFPSEGRNVRCAKCAHVWHQEAPAPEFEPEAEIVAPVPVAPPGPAPAPRPSAYASEPVVATAEVPSKAASSWPRRLGVGAGFLALAALVLGIGWTTIAYREQIATLWPQSSSLYAALGMKANASGIDFDDVAYRRETQGGQIVLAVSGKLVNKTSRELPVPQIRVALIDDDRRELYHWTFVPAVMTLRPGQVTSFVTRLSNPPAAAHRFEVRFAKAGE